MTTSSNPMRCQQCQNEIAQGLKFCPQCGAAVVVAKSLVTLGIEAYNEGEYERAIGDTGLRRGHKARPAVWGRRGLFHGAALAGPSLFLTEGPFDALAMLGSDFPAASLVGTKGLPWDRLGNVRELYLCLDLDATGKARRPPMNWPVRLSCGVFAAM
jgi:hypothetical protein